MIYAKTEAGQRAFKERSPLLSARQRSVFILFDGLKSLEQVLAATAGLGITSADVEYLVAQGFLHEQVPADLPRAMPAEAVGASDEALSPQARYAKAYPLATQLTASLGLRGFRLNLAVEAAGGYEDLLALLPRISEAVGPQACQTLAQALKD